MDQRLEYTSLYCNTDYILHITDAKNVKDILSNGLQLHPRCPKIYKWFPNIFASNTQQNLDENLLQPKFDGVYGMLVLKQWSGKSFADLEIGYINRSTDIALVINKASLLHIPFHFNLTVDGGLRTDGNTFESYARYGEDTILDLNVLRKMDDLMNNELVFHQDINPAFIEEIWYFDEKIPSAMYDSVCRKPIRKNTELQF